MNLMSSDIDYPDLRNFTDKYKHSENTAILEIFLFVKFESQTTELSYEQRYGIWQMQEKLVAFGMFNSIFVDIFLAPRAITRLTIGFASEFLSHACC